MKTYLVDRTWDETGYLLKFRTKHFRKGRCKAWSRLDSRKRNFTWMKVKQVTLTKDGSTC